MGRCIVCENIAPLVPGTGMCGPCCTGDSDTHGASFTVSKPKPAPITPGRDNVSITKAQMDELFKPEKGWVCYSNQGEHYIYEYKVPDSIIRVKVNSAVQVATGTVHWDGTDQIKVWAIAYEEHPKNVWGLCKALTVKPSPGWEGRIKLRFKEAMAQAKRNLAPLRKK